MILADSSGSTLYKTWQRSRDRYGGGVLRDEEDVGCLIEADETGDIDMTDE
jgi:hypothetical protein